MIPTLIGITLMIFSRWLGLPRALPAAATFGNEGERTSKENRELAIQEMCTKTGYGG